MTNDIITKKLLHFSKKDIIELLYDEYYNDFLSDISLSEISKKTMNKYYFFRADNMEKLFDYQNIKHRIYMKILNKEDNICYLKDKYYVSYLDLAVIYYVDLQENYNTYPDRRGIAITQSIFDYWSITDDVIQKQTLKNMESESAFMLKRDTYNENCVLYDAFEKNQNAVAITNPTTLHYIKELLKEPFYILPLSVHDIIIIPKIKIHTQAQLNKMKKSIIESNDNLPSDQIVSNNIYYYDGYNLIIAI